MPLTPKRFRASSVLAAVARQSPTAPAITSNGVSISYGDFVRSVEALADRLHSFRDTPISGLESDRAATMSHHNRIAFLTPPTAVYAQALLACWASGAAAVPLSPLYPRSALASLIRDADPQLTLTAGEYQKPDTGCNSGDASSSQTPEHLHIEDFFNDVRSSNLISGRLLSGPPDKCRVDDSGSPARSRGLIEVTDATSSASPAMILFTSGTTGSPKGVVWTHGMVDYQVSTLSREWRWTSDDHILNTLPLHHVHGVVNVLLTSLYTGAHCTMMNHFDAEAVWRSFASRPGCAPTVFMAVPTMYQRLIRRYDAADRETRQKWSRAVRAMRLFVCGSAALPEADFESWFRISGHRILERYGMTETGMVLSNPFDDRVRASLGVPLPGVDVKVVGDTAAVGVDGTLRGELRVRSPGVFSNYWRREQETAVAFDNEGYFKTGDVVEMDAVSHRFRMLGRASTDIIKTGGYKVSALEIEHALAESPRVSTSAVFGVDDSDLGQRLECVVVLKPKKDTSTETLPVDHFDVKSEAESLSRWLSERLPKYKVPRRIRITSENDLPRNALGKVQKKILSKMYDATETDVINSSLAN